MREQLREQLYSVACSSAKRSRQREPDSTQRCKKQQIWKISRMIFSHVLPFSIPTIGTDIGSYQWKNDPVFVLLFVLLSVLLSQWYQCSARVGFGRLRSEKWRKNIFHFSREVQSEIKMFFSRSASEKKRLEIEIENFCEFKKDRFWSIGKGALPSTKG